MRRVVRAASMPWQSHVPHAQTFNHDRITLEAPRYSLKRHGLGTGIVLPGFCEVAIGAWRSVELTASKSHCLEYQHEI